MRLFLASVTCLLIGAVLSITALFTDTTFTAFGSTFTAVGALLAVVNMRRRSREDRQP